MNYEEAVDFCKNNPEIAAHIIMEIEKLKEIIQQQNDEIKRLQSIISKDSSNSSKPPSTDNKLTKESKTSNKKSKMSRKRGGQKGHKGVNLKMVSDPDYTVQLSVDKCHCGCDLSEVKSSRVVKRQIFDIPEIKMEVTEYEQHTRICPKCKRVNKASFPDTLKASVQYGENLKSLIAYCNSYQMLPYARISEMIEDFTSHKISTGTIYTILQSYYDKLESYEENIKGLLLQEKVIHCDETGISIKGKLHFTHVISSSLLTYYMLHAKRGKVAINEMGILPDYHGICVHDHWSAYYSYKCQHSYCNAHYLRELTFIAEQEKEIWAQNMHKLLRTMNKTVYKAKKRGKTALPARQLNYFLSCYDKICKSALVYYPPPKPKTTKSKGRTRQPKGKNLLDRLVKYRNETLRFLTDFAVPFTNNLAERDLRMIKVKQKISGTFASFRGGEIFNRIRGYISTVKKNNRHVLEELKNGLSGNVYSPVGCGC